MKKWRIPAFRTGEAKLVAPILPTGATRYYRLAWFATLLIFVICFLSRDFVAIAICNTAKIVACTEVASTLSLAVGTQSMKVWNLSEVAWTVSNDALNISVPGNLPSHVHLDLYKAQVIGDPYWSLNDFNLRWITWNNWTYSAKLPIPPKNSGSTWLLFNGLDTFTSIDLCGQHVASTSNQFRQYYFNVSQVVASCQGQPLLSINFGSVPTIANQIAAQPGQETWPYSVQYAGLFEFPNRQFVRKEQSDFGWDWGPAFLPVGPWLPAYAIQLGASDLYIRNTLIDIYRQGQMPLIPPDQSRPWVLNVSLDVIGILQSDASLTYTLTDHWNSTVLSGHLGNITARGETITGSVVIPPGTVELWWPSGLGRQVLYSLELTITNGNDTGSPVVSVTKRVGFRTIVLNQEPIRQDQLDKGIAPGNNWHFEVNGHEFYAKGSNFIPPDTFWPRVTPQRVEQLFNAVVASNQNMLRVWGGGAYSPDFLYDIADELGVLLWTEFEFGDSLYPVDHEFLDNVREEATYQVRRLNYHPSLALWAGGNELENVELAQINETVPDQYDRYLAEYEKLFLDVLVPCVFENSRSISYIPSSTTNGWLSVDFSKPQPITQRYNNKTEGSIYGNRDYWNYNATISFNTRSYPVGRFTNEFGMHSMPSLQTWQQAIAPEDMYFNSSVIQLRNHHYPVQGLNISDVTNSTRGMAEMTMTVQHWLPVPTKTDSIANFSSWCHVTQLFQASFIKSQISFYRRGSGMPERQLGCLYWQLEDIWQAPTWASIEYDGRWKVLHYTVKDIYQSVIITPFSNATTGDFEVYVTSDLWRPASGTATFAWYDWAGNRLSVPTPASVDVSVGAINTTCVLQANLHDILASYDPRDVVLRMEVNLEGQLPNSLDMRTFNHVNWFHAVDLSQARLVDPGLQFRYYGDSFSVRASRGVGAWVWLDYPAGSVVQFENNGFWLKAGEERAVRYKIISGTIDEAWAKGVTVQSLWDLTIP